MPEPMPEPMPVANEIEIRSCAGFDELSACVQLQTEVWGYGDGDVIPRRAFIVAQKIGGQVIGAFDPRGSAADSETAFAAGPATAPALVGFAMALPGISPGGRPGTPGTPYLHSHMLAVRPEYRNQGLGRRLKLLQREEALARGIERMEWTFDPLEAKNAYLNLVRLGVIARAYSANFYGVSSSRLQAGLPTDRLHAEWWLTSDRVKAALTGIPVHPMHVQERISIPKEIAAWKASPAEQARALDVQMRNRVLFQKAFAQGLAVTGFTIDSEGNGVFELSRCGDPATLL